MNAPKSVKTGANFQPTLNKTTWTSEVCLIESKVSCYGIVLESHPIHAECSKLLSCQNSILYDLLKLYQNKQALTIQNILHIQVNNSQTYLPPSQVNPNHWMIYGDIHPNLLSLKSKQNTQEPKFSESISSSLIVNPSMHVFLWVIRAKHKLFSILFRLNQFQVVENLCIHIYNIFTHTIYIYTYTHTISYIFTKISQVLETYQASTY